MEAAVALGLVIVTAWAFAAVRHFGFVALDDPAMVSENPHVLGGLTWANVKSAFDVYFNFWIPATYLSYMADVQLHGLNASWMHITNLALHLGSVVLLFLLLARTTGEMWKAAVVAALFAVHPLHVESVVWIAERKDVLSTFAWFLTTVAYVWYTRQPTAMRYAAVLVAFAFGLMAKPMLVTLPATLLLLDFWPLGRLSLDARDRWWPLLREKLPLVALTLVFSVVAYVAQGEALGSVEAYPLSARLANVVTSYVTYVVKMLWPVDLSVLYPFTNEFSAGLVFIAAVALVAATIVAWRLARRAPYLAVGWLWFVGTLVPVIGFVQVGIFARADRFTYVPLIGLFMVLAWGVPDLLRAWPAVRRVLPVFTVAAVIGLVMLTRDQVLVWRDTVSLWQHTARVLLGQDDATAQQLVVRMLMSQQRTSDLAEHFGAAAPQTKGVTPVPPLLPVPSATDLDQGRALARQRKFAEAADVFARAAAANPRDPAPLGEWGLVLVNSGKVDEGIQKYRDALALDGSLAIVHSNLGAALAGKGQTQAALAEFLEAVRLRPDLADAQDNAGLALAQLERVDDALPYFARAVRLRPDKEIGHMHYGIALARLGRLAEARREFQEVLRLNPKNQEARQALAEIKEGT